MNLRLLLLGLVFSSFISCMQYKSNEIITISDIVDQSRRTNKMTLICLSDSIEPILDKDISKLVHEKFLFFNINTHRENIFYKILHTNYSPLFVVLQGDSLKAIFTMPKDQRSFFSTFHTISDYSDITPNLSDMTDLQASNEKILQGFNHTLRLEYIIEKKYSNDILFKTAEQALNILPYFYNHYLMSEICSQKDSTQKDNINDSLWINATKLERTIYTKELLNIYSNISRRAKQNKSTLEFNTPHYDFGFVKIRDTMEYEYKFLNKGNKPVVITSTNSLCDCTTTDWPRSPISQGVSHSIKVRFIPREIGVNHKTIEIRTSEPACIKLTLTATVIRD